MSKKPCNVALGRFQPFTKGHLQMLKDGYDKNGYPAIVFMIANKKFDSKHPFTDELIAEEMEIVKKNYPFVAEIVPATSADIVKIGQKLDEMGYEAHLWLCGDDREAQFKRQAENPKYREQGHFPDDFTTYTGTGRTEGVSGTAVRQTLKDDNKEAFKKLMPKGTDILFDKMKEEISHVKESLISLEDYINNINEKYKDKYGNVILTKDDITLDVLKNAVYSSSFMNDRAVLIMSDSGSWVKIKKDSWQYQSTIASALGSTISSEELWKKVEKSDKVKMYER